MTDRKAVFVDLQGTLGGESLGDIRGFSFYPFSISAIKLLNENNLLVIVVTNQSRISKGCFTYTEFAERLDGLKRQLAARGARFDGVYCCPHRKVDNCSCMKPSPKMLLQAQEDLTLNLTQSYVVGDDGTKDIVMARSAGCRAILVRTGLGDRSLTEYRDLWADLEPDFIAADILDAASRIVAIERVPGNQKNGV